MDCLSPVLAVPAGGVHEGGAGRGHGKWQLLDWVRDPPGAGADDGGGADGGAGQAQLQAAARPADRGERGPARAGQGAPEPGQRQYRALEGVPGRGADPDRRQQRGRAALDAGALSVPGRGRRLSGRRRGRGRSDPARGAAVGDLPAAQDPAGLDAQDQGPVADRAGVRAERPAAVLRALPALPRASDAGASEPPLARGPAAGGRVRLRALRQPDRRAAQDLDAGARRVAAHRSRAMAGPPGSTSPACTARSGGSAGPMPPRCTSRPGRRPT